MKGFNTTAHSEGFLINLVNEYKKLGVDTIRHQLVNLKPEIINDRKKYKEWLAFEVDKLVRAASAVGPGMRWICDLHHTFKLVSQVTNEHYILTDEGSRYWLEDVQYIAEKIKGSPYIFAIEVVNEPWSRPIKYRKFLEHHRKTLRLMAQYSSKIFYISSAYGLPGYLKYLPRLGSRLQPTAHIWPAQSLRFEGEKGPNDEKWLASERVYEELNKVIAYERESKRKVLVGEVGCLKFNGVEFQRTYIKKQLSYAVKNRLSIFLHGEHGNPQYAYEHNGIWDIVKEAYA